MKIIFFAILSLVAIFPPFSLAEDWFDWQKYLSPGTKVFVTKSTDSGSYIQGTFQGLDEKGMAKIKLESGAVVVDEMENLGIITQDKSITPKMDWILLPRMVGDKKMFLKANVLGIKDDSMEVILVPAPFAREKATVLKNSEFYKYQSLRNLVAPECGRKNILYDEKKLGRPRLMPQYDQGPDGICYAYTGLQLVDFYREVMGPHYFKQILLGDAIYAALVARIYRNSQGQSNEIEKRLSGGFSSDVVEGIRRYGMCKSDATQKSLQKYFNANHINPQEFYFLSEFLLTSHTNKAKDAETVKEGKKSMKEFMRETGKRVKRETSDSLLGEFRKTEAAEYAKLAADTAKMEVLGKALEPYIESDNYVAFLENVFSECKESQNIILSTKKRPPSVHLNGLEGGWPIRKIYEKIVEILNQEKSSGVAIGYCARVLKDHTIRGMDRQNKTLLDNCGGHASLVVGKRFRGGRCQFLVRNSWGHGCPYYDNKWDCELDQKGQEEGVWVDAQALSDNIDELDFFPK